MPGEELQSKGCRRRPGRHRSRRLIASAGLLATAVALALACVAGVVLATVAGSGAPAAAQSDPPPAPNTQLGRIYSPRTVISEPFVLTTPKIDYLYSSGFGGTINIPLRTFTKMGKFSRAYNPLPQVPAWVQPGTNVWSPDVRKIGKTYVMWFSALAASSPPTDNQPHPRCLGWASATSPYGPFVSNATAPQLCQWSQFGDIDPRTFLDGKQEYLIWKSDDNSVPRQHKTTKIWSQKLATNGTTLEGQPTLLLQSSRFWQGPIVESPNMVKRHGRYYLFYSGNSSGIPGSGIGLAHCKGPSGPCSSPLNGPWLGSNSNGSGPDEESLFSQDGATWLIYTPQSVYYPGSYPFLAVSRVVFGPKGPYVAEFGGAHPNP